MMSALRSAVSHAALAAAATSFTATAQSPSLLVTSRFTDQVLGYDAAGQFAGVFAAGNGLDNPVGATFGSDGNLYVSSGNTNQVLRFDGATGAPLGALASVAAPRQINAGPDGLLYVCSASSARVLRYTTSGQFVDTFVQSPLIAGNTSMTFGPDFDLYVGSVTNNQVVRFDGATGALLGVFANVGMAGTHDLCFGPDGDLYVSNAFANNVARFDGTTGAYLGVFVGDPGLVNPLGLAFGEDGALYVANQGGDDVRRYDGATGAPLGAFVSPGSGGLDGPLFTVFVRHVAGLSTHAPLPGVAGQTSHLTIVGAQAGGAVVVGVGTTAANVPLPCPGLSYGIGDPLLLAFGPADEGGRLVTRFFVPAALQGQSFLFQAIDFSACTVGNLLLHTL